MAHRKIKRNFDILSTFDYFIPGPAEIFILIALLVAGLFLGALLGLPILFLTQGSESSLLYFELVSYPVMFIPPMIYASYKSRSNSFFGTGLKVSNDHYKPLGGWMCAILVVAGTLTGSFVSDALASLLPPMPDSLTEALKAVTSGNILLNLLCVSVFAPFFEEWLCRGMVLRGLLGYEHKNKEGETVKGIKPVWAIVISAVFFALIHLNPWQAIPAFLMGLLLGYVYYRTGSIKLTMLMHCANNTFAVVMANMDKFKDIEKWSDVMPALFYASLLIFCAAVVLYVVYKFKEIKLLAPQGSFEPVSPYDEVKG